LWQKWLYTWHVMLSRETSCEYYCRSPLCIEQQQESWRWQEKFTLLPWVALKDVSSVLIEEKSQYHITTVKNVIYDSVVTHVSNCTTTSCTTKHLCKVLWNLLMYNIFRAEVCVITNCDSSRCVFEVDICVMSVKINSEYNNWNKRTWPKYAAMYSI
jgi:hypothetical protein